MTRLFAALYVSEIWYAGWKDRGSLHAKARAMVVFDRILTGNEHRMTLNGVSLNDFFGRVES